MHELVYVLTVEAAVFGSLGVRERVLFIGNQFSNLYTAVDTPAAGCAETDCA